MSDLPLKLTPASRAAEVHGRGPPLEDDPRRRRGEETRPVSLRRRHGGGVAALGQEPGGGQPGRAAADHSHPFAARRHPLEGCWALVRDHAVKRADGHGFVHLPATADRFAVGRTDVSQDGREGQLFAHDSGRGRDIARGQGLQIRGYVDVGRTCVGAGRLAVGVVVGEVHLQIALAPSTHAGRVGLHDHALRRRRRAGGLKLAHPLHFHEAETASTPCRRPRFVAERGDVDAFAAGHLDDGLAFVSVEVSSVSMVSLMMVLVRVLTVAPLGECRHACLHPDRVEPTRLATGVALDAQILIDDVSLFALPAHGCDGAGRQTGPAASTGRLVYRVPDQSPAALRRTAMLDDVGQDLFLEVAQGRQHRVGGAAAERAERALGHIGGQLLQQIHLVQRGRTGRHAL